ncbi:precorrin-4 C(11)-methyltransferase [Nitratidesulfovibrio sp. HK-II]|uniref:precorrin-4 C(11)-methyltransferase n=1 Tax=Nitratidesulfovibrio sp. HK-II TaxID=2009266 RepID=UPI000E2E58BF|nr:precorrin-4 C(11)-methyltransferase [Nitratidesulfovibrio sp. HK-II]GBO95174.1 cobalt-precorrin-4 C11-methyltransferase [Nitratidesulfovibrio sp. HK-II]
MPITRNDATGSGPVPSRGHVWFVGAGPGDPELLTLKARRIIGTADLVLYAGSLVPPEVVACARPDARVVDSAPLTLEQTHALLRETALSGGVAARVHTGDPSLYGTVREQMRLLHAEGIACSVVPGVTAAFAAAAAAGVSFTVPEVTQSLVITRLEGRTPVPETEQLRELARHGCSMAVYLSAAAPERLEEELAAAGIAAHTPVLAAHRVGWPDQALAWTTAGGLAETVRRQGFSRQTVFLVLPGEAAGDTASRLYAADFAHGWRAAPQADKDGTGGEG